MAKRKSYKSRIIAGIIAVFILLAGAAWYLVGVSVPVLESRGVIANEERDLIYITLLMSLVVVVPVFTMLAVFSWKYREANTKATYRPDWDHNRLFEAIWWLVPAALITVLSIIIWRSSYDLNPYKPLTSSKEAVKIQVVALDWKWLFIYPDKGVASVNYLQIPEKTPINFEISADAPMNSFWIPQLGGQMYAMPGMSTKLHLRADHVGEYYGSSANISGRGFADMNFLTKSTSQNDFNKWLAAGQSSNEELTPERYEWLMKPGLMPATVYRLTDDNLYDTIVMKYMAPSSNDKHIYKSMVEQ